MSGDKTRSVEQGRATNETNAPARELALQWKYTACAYNIERANGFYTFSKSEGITDAEKAELVDMIARYEAPDSMPLQPTDDDLKAFPVAFSSFRLSSGRLVVASTRAVGRDYGGSRFGNFFSHALVQSRANADWDRRYLLCLSDAFSQGLTPEEAKLERVPDPLPTVEIERPSARPVYEALRQINPQYVSALRFIVDRLIDAVKKRVNLVVLMEDAQLVHARLYLAAALNLMPNVVADRISFSSYSLNPAFDPLFKKRDFIYMAFAPRNRKSSLATAACSVFDLAEALEKPSEIPSRAYARELSSELNEFADAFTFEAYQIDRSKFVVDPGADARKNEPDLFDAVVRLRHMTKGGFPEDDRALANAWRVLFEQSPEATFKVLGKIFENDFSSDRRAIREIVAFSILYVETFAKEYGWDGENSFSLGDVMTFWLRNAPIIPADSAARKKVATVFVDDIELALGVRSVARRVFDKMRPNELGKTLVPIFEEMVEAYQRVIDETRREARNRGDAATQFESFAFHKSFLPLAFALFLIVREPEVAVADNVFKPSIAVADIVFKRSPELFRLFGRVFADPESFKLFNTFFRGFIGERFTTARSFDSLFRLLSCDLKEYEAEAKVKKEETTRTPPSIVAFFIESFIKDDKILSAAASKDAANGDSAIDLLANDEEESAPQQLVFTSVARAAGVVATRPKKKKNKIQTDAPRNSSIALIAALLIYEFPNVVKLSVEKSRLSNSAIAKLRNELKKYGVKREISREAFGTSMKRILYSAYIIVALIALIALISFIVLRLKKEMSNDLSADARPAAQIARTLGSEVDGAARFVER